MKIQSVENSNFMLSIRSNCIFIRYYTLQNNKYNASNYSRKNIHPYDFSLFHAIECRHLIAIAGCILNMQSVIHRFRCVVLNALVTVVCVAVWYTFTLACIRWQIPCHRNPPRLVGSSFCLFFFVARPQPTSLSDFSIFTRARNAQVNAKYNTHIKTHFKILMNFILIFQHIGAISCGKCIWISSTLCVLHWTLIGKYMLSSFHHFTYLMYYKFICLYITHINACLDM